MKHGPCDVCVLTKGDFAEKDVYYCPLCDSDICMECKGRYDLRAVAAIKSAAQRVLSRLGLTEGVA